jgi:hemerythrin-like domain-containing protein
MSEAITSLSDCFGADHRRCDALLAEVESAVDAQDWSDAARAWSAFRQTVERHLQTEESVLFPALERDGGTAGPIEVMRMEHGEMRDLIGELDQAIARHSGHEGLGIIETLLMLTQQHNLKEEAVLYALADDLLDARTRGDIAAGLQP